MLLKYKSISSLLITLVIAFQQKKKKQRIIAYPTCKNKLFASSIGLFMIYGNLDYIEKKKKKKKKNI